MIILNRYSVLYTPVTTARACVVLAHGAGAPMDSAFMGQLSAALVQCEFSVMRFEFPYMQDRRETGVKKPPNRMPVLLQHYGEVVQSILEYSPLPVIIAGKSMGGRVASMLLADSSPRVVGCACFGYPFYPQGNPGKSRIEHLRDLQRPMLVCQGTRDPMGKPDVVKDYPLSAVVSVQWLDTADHDYKPLVRSGRCQKDVVFEAANNMSQWFNGLQL